MRAQFRGAKAIWDLAWPNALSNLVGFSIQVGSMLFVGHLGSMFLDAIALGNMFANFTGYSIGFGMLSALDTLCSQAFGAKQYLLCGRQTQRAIVILTLMCIPISVVWLQTEASLVLIGMDPDISRLAGDFTVLQIAGMWPAFVSGALRKFLLAQQIVWPTVVSACMSSLLNLLACYIFIFPLNLGFRGAAYAAVCANWASLLTLVALTYLRLWWRRRVPSGASSSNALGFIDTWRSVAATRSIAASSTTLYAPVKIVGPESR